MSDYAVIKTGGKQYIVQSGDVIQVERLPYDQGDSVKLTDVLLLSTDGDIKVGTPFVEGVSVDAQVEENSRGKKIVVFKYKNKTRYRRKQGHRQEYTELKITKLGSKSQSKAVKPKKSASTKKSKTEQVTPADPINISTSLSTQIVEIVLASLEGTPSEKRSSTREANKLLQDAGVSSDSLKNLVATVRKNLDASDGDTKEIVNDLSQKISEFLT